MVVVFFFLFFAKSSGYCFYEVFLLTGWGGFYFKYRFDQAEISL